MKLYFKFWGGTAIIFPTRTIPFHTFISSEQLCWFLHNLANTCFLFLFFLVFFFNNSHFNEYEVALTLLFKFFLLIYLWVHLAFIAASSLSLVATNGAILCCGAQVSHCSSFSCRAQALGCSDSEVETHAFVAAQHVESSRIRERTQVPCIGRRILNDWTTKEAQLCFLIIFFLFLQPFHGSALLWDKVQRYNLYTVNSKAFRVISPYCCT